MLASIIILLFRISENFVLHLYRFKQTEKPSFTYRMRIWKGKCSFEKVGTFCQKDCEFGNCRRFMLKCLQESITPVNVKLKNMIRTPKSYKIIQKS